MRTNPPRKQRRKGLQVVGPGFYLWDTDAREALRLAAELSPRKAPLPVRRPRIEVHEPVA